MGPADKKKGYFRFWFFAIQFHLSIVVICSGGFAVGVSLWGKGPGQGKWTDGWSDVCARSEKNNRRSFTSMVSFFFFPCDSQARRLSYVHTHDSRLPKVRLSGRSLPRNPGYQYIRTASPRKHSVVSLPTYTFNHYHFLHLLLNFTQHAMVRQILKVANFRTVSRCWVPALMAQQQPMLRFFSSRQRCINFNNINEHDNSVNLISNDDVFAAEEIKHQNEAPFEPTVFSSEDVFTAGPVNKA